MPLSPALLQTIENGVRQLVATVTDAITKMAASEEHMLEVLRTNKADLERATTEAQAKLQGVLDQLSAAKAEADKVRADAKAYADKTRLEAEASAKDLIAQAKFRATTALRQLDAA
jgi:hypothetical protein